MEELGLGGRHGARGRHLHQMTLYEGVIDVEDVKYELEKVEAYLSDVGRVLEGEAWQRTQLPALTRCCGKSSY